MSNTKLTKELNKLKKLGRPSDYCEEVVQEICDRLSEGEGLVSICNDDHMPEQKTVYRWLSSKEEFCQRYTRAREEQADTLADQILAIADESPETVPVYDKEGNVIDIKIDAGYVAYQKQRIEARKWTAMKLKPKKYGDKVAVGGDPENPIKIENELGIFGDILDALRMKRQSE